MVRRKSASNKRTSPTIRAINQHAAGIDLGSRTHFVALPPGRGEQTVREFDCFTEDLEAMAKWLKDSGITTVAMEATGVYWVPVFQILEKHGLDPKLVDTRHLRGVPGRKTDVEDCQWLQHLHECGLLRGAFRPEDEICVLRNYVRQRDTLTAEASTHILRMQKALEQMNIQLHKVVSSIVGLTGMAIIKAILAGERDSVILAQLRDRRCKKTSDEIAKALRGDWRNEHLFCLRQEVEIFEYLQTKIEACEKEMAERWREFDAKAEIRNAPPPTKPKCKINEDLRLQIYRAAGADLTQIPGLTPWNLQTIIGEVGKDMSPWPNEKAFCSWLRLCPNSNVTGGKRRKARKSTACNRAAESFRVAAQALERSNSSLGAFYRRIRGRKGGAVAVVATAHKLAKQFYRTLKYGQTYVEHGVDYYEQKYRDQMIRSAVKRLNTLGQEVELRPTTA